MINFKAMGQRVREERRARNLTQEQLSERLDISVEHLSRIETGSYRPSLTLIEKMAGVLELEERELMFGSDGERQESRALLDRLCAMGPEKRQAAERILDIIAGL